MEIRTLIGQAPVACEPQLALADAASRMLNNGVGSLAVTIGDTLVGIFTERDLLRAVTSGAKLDTEQVQDWMTGQPDALSPGADIVEAAQWMLATGYRHMPVIDEGDLMGIVSIKDVLWALSEPANWAVGGTRHESLLGLPFS